ncbi:MAG: hypothetical protein OXI92_16855 [Acidobacteriota bacterium]|nr:hypothetical protein [Acidobacteriota bacterium]
MNQSAAPLHLVDQPNPKEPPQPPEVEADLLDFPAFRFLESFFRILSLVITTVCILLIISSGLVLWILLAFFS